MVDLQVALREQIYAIVDSVQPKAKYKTLVIDEKTQRIFSHCLETHDLLNRSVANVQLIDAKRQTEQYLDAVYITECSEYSTGCISTDFRRRPPRYRAAHVFFLPGGSEGMIAQFKNSFMAPYLERVDIAPIHFFAVERQLFSLGDPYANLRLYNPHCKPDLIPFIDLMGQQIASACLCLNELPYIRYFENGVSQIPELVASAVNAHLQHLRPRFMSPDKESGPRTTLLIMDRSLDLFAPFMHDFTFQAMAYDVLKFKDDDFNHFQSLDGAVEGKLTEQDPDWTALRHKHISEVIEKLTARVRELREANPHFVDQQSDVSVRDVRDMMANLPNFVKNRDSVSLNLEVALECMDAVDKLQLKELAEFEQSAALGKDAHQQKLDQKFTDQLVELLADPDMTVQQKQRLISVYALYRQRGLFAKDWARLGKHSQLERQDLDTLVNLSVLGGPMVKNSDYQPQLPKQYAFENPDDQLLFARFTPGVKKVMEALLEGTLDRDQFPYYGEEPSHNDMAVEVATSLRNPRQRATWAQNTAAQKNKKTVRRQVLGFMIGGYTAAEARSVYELAEKYPKDVILGSNDFMTPAKFLSFLRQQKTDRQQLGLPYDEPPKPIPRHLEASDRENRQPVNPQGPQGPQAAQAPVANGHGQQRANYDDGSNAFRNNGNLPVPSSNDTRLVNDGLLSLSLQTPEPAKKEKSVRSKLKGAFRGKKII